MTDLPELVIYLIFRVLDVEDMARCAAVGKSWYSCLCSEEHASKVLQKKLFPIADKTRNSLLMNLLNQDPSGNGRSEQQWTPLHIAARRGYVELAKALISYGVTVDARNVYGRTPLSYACQFGEEDIAKELIQHGAHVNAHDNRGRGPLLWAAGGGNASLIELLLANGANVSEEDPSGNTALHRAADRGKAGEAEVLLEYGANVNAENNNGEIPLLYAVQQRCPNTVQVLLQRGNPYWRNDYHRKLIQIARETKFPEIEELLRQAINGMKAQPNN